MQECRDDGATDLKSTMYDMMNHKIITTYIAYHMEASTYLRLANTCIQYAL